MNRTHIIRWVLILTTMVMLAPLFLVRRASASTFTVVTAADNGNDASPTPGSLRQAIVFANSVPGLDTINFNIPGPLFNIPTITPLSPLPVITSPVIIDGTTQGIFGQVELDGESAGSGQLLVSGLIITAGGSTIKGLVINRFSNNGITLASSGNIVQGCFIGTDVSGTTPLSNGNQGVFINGSSFTASNNIIGGTSAATRNIISANTAAGIDIVASGATGNLIQGNYIGTDVNGTAVLGNGIGVLIEGGAGQNSIGGSSVGARNVISGNRDVGVEINQNGTSGNTIAGNYIGTDASGTVAVRNGLSFGFGVAIYNSSNNEIGNGLLPGNLISGNNGHGVLISGDSFVPATGNQVLKNFIGTNATGTASLRNFGNGVLVDGGVAATGATGNRIGMAGFGNLISGNSDQGVYIQQGSSNTVEGNRIGTDVNGAAPLPNAGGVTIAQSSNNSIGGAGGGAGNLISGNVNDGIRITNGSSNTIAGNFIGTNAAGTAALGNGSNGVAICGSMNNGVGGTTTAARNLISGNTLAGVNICSNSSSNSVQGNYIGTNVSGSAAIPNQFNGVEVDGNSNVIGGVSNARNLVSGNALDGIAISGNGNIVQNNYVGTDAAGVNAISNGFAGVAILGTADFNWIGERNITFFSEGNRIAFNGRQGVLVDNGVTHAIIRGNSIFSNTGLGIDLVSSNDPPNGVTPNDACDGDSGANYLQNFPVISSITRNAINITINGTLNSMIFNDYVIDFFSNPSCNPAGNGEGKTYLGSTLLSIGNNCVTSFSVTLAAPSSELSITATATRVDLSLQDGFETSEFSACATAPTAIEFAGATASAYDQGVLLEWQTGFEVDNLGFNIYRESSGKRELLNSQPVAGSALLVGPATTLGAGRSYTWWDPRAVDDRSSNYWIEDLDLNGQSTWHGPISARDADDAAPKEKTERARLLGATETGERDSRPVETRASRGVTGDGVRTSLAKSLLQQQLAAGPAVKIAVKQEGWHRVSQPELIQAGLDPKTDPRRLQLYASGKPIPIIVSGESDGRFDEGDAIEFYGIGLDSPATDKHIYWLATGTQFGTRINTVASPAPSIQPASIPFTIERRDRTTYFAGLLNGEAENFFGAVITSQPADQSVTVTHFDTEAARGASLEVVLQGVTQIPHRVSLQMNGAFVGEMAFNNQAQCTAHFSLSQGLLASGTNHVTLTAEAGPSDVSLVDHIRLTYSHTTTADDNQLKLTATGNQRLTVFGFTNERIRLLDITDPADVAEIAGSIEKHNDDCYSISLTVPGNGQRVLLALTHDRAKQAATITANAPSNLRNWNSGADLIIIHHDMEEALAPLVAARQRQKLSVTTVDVEDIFDEFSFGEKSTQAIKDFLNFAGRSWKKKPQYVLIVGDASYDPKNYLRLGDDDVVPTKLIDTSFLETASDDWFVDFNNDDLAEMAVGRLPAKTSEEAAVMVGRLLSYEASRPTDESLLVADIDDGYNFVGANEQLRSLLPENIKAIEIKRGALGEQAKSELISAVNRGQRIVNYAGHGSVDRWRGNLLTADNAGALTNQNHLTLFVIMSCLNGYFDDPARDSLAEALIKTARGGAVAVWASSGMTSPNEQTFMNQELYRQLFGNRSIRLGDAIRAAKKVIADRDVRRTWILLGDPTMRVK